MVYFKEYLVTIGEREKRLGIVGEEHELYTAKESKFVSGLVDRYQIVAAEELVTDNEPVDMKISRMLSSLTFPFARAGLGRSRGRWPVDYAEEKDKYRPLENQLSVGWDTENRYARMLDLALRYARLSLDALIVFRQYFKRRNNGIVEEPKDPKTVLVSHHKKERTIWMAFDLDRDLCKDKVDSLLAIVGKRHFNGVINELKNFNDMTEITELDRHVELTKYDNRGHRA